LLQRWVWRVSLFFYVTYPYEPYFTYYRVTNWLGEQPTILGLEILKREGYEEVAEREEEENIRASPKVEVEQLLEGVDETMPVGSVGVSRSDGSIPEESYVGFRQTHIDGSYDDGVEDQGTW